MIIQAILSFFILFALSRVLLQVRQAKLSIGAFLFWSALFIFALGGVLDPRLTSFVAHWFGIGRGTDIVIYISIALLFYLIFRLSITLEETKREITELVRKIALDMHRNSFSKSKIKRKK
jgi:hypothetical protein